MVLQSNCSALLHKLLQELSNHTHYHPVPVHPTLSQDAQDDKDRHAVLYIVVVLLFYSCGIVIAIIMYLKREKNEAEEEKAFDDYMNFRQDPDKRMRYHRVQTMIAQLNEVTKQQQLKNKEKEKLGKRARLKLPVSWHRKGSKSRSTSSFKMPLGSSRSLEQGTKLHVTEMGERSRSWAGRDSGTQNTDTATDHIVDIIIQTQDTTLQEET